MLLFSGWNMVENINQGRGNVGVIKKIEEDDDDDAIGDVGRILTEKEKEEEQKRAIRREKDARLCTAVLGSCDPNFVTSHVHAILCPPSVTESDPRGDHRVALHRRFDFLSHLQRMSVIVRNESPNSLYEVFVKGSPEIISSLCMSHTVPSSFADTLSVYTKRGLRVLALAHRVLDRNALLSTGSPSLSSLLSSSNDPLLTEEEIDKLPRVDVECDLTFLGLLIVENKIRETTPIAIEKLNNAAIKTVMITGDNALTGVNVAKNCGLIPSYVETTYHKTEKRTAVKEPPIFLCELNDDEDVIWRCTEDPKLRLNPETLLPYTQKFELPPSSSLAISSVHSPEMGDLTATITPGQSPRFTVSLINVPSTLTLANNPLGYNSKLPISPSSSTIASSFTVQTSTNTVSSENGANSSSPSSVDASSPPAPNATVIPDYSKVSIMSSNSTYRSDGDVDVFVPPSKINTKVFLLNKFILFGDYFCSYGQVDHGDP
jgi:hypothetical protein